MSDEDETDEIDEPEERTPEFRHLKKQPRLLLDQGIEARVSYTLADHWIGYAAADRALKAMKDLLSLPHTTTSPSLLLLGRPGNGKTTILRKFCSEYGPQIRANGDLGCQVLTMDIPPKDESEFWTEVLHACGIGHRVTDPALKKKENAYSSLIRMRPRMLIGDELNNLAITSGGNQRLIMARLRELTNKLSIHLVLAGTEEAAAAVDSDKQMARRLPPYELPRWIANKKQSMRLLRSIEALIPLPAPSNLINNDLAPRIFARSDETISSIAYTVKQAGVNAIRAGADKIGPEHLDAVRIDTKDERARRVLSL